MSGEMGRLMRLDRIEPNPESCERPRHGVDFRLHCSGTLADERFTWLSEKATGYWLVACGAGPDGEVPEEPRIQPRFDATIKSKEPVVLGLYGTPEGIQEEGFADGTWVNLIPRHIRGEQDLAAARPPEQEIDG